MTNEDVLDQVGLSPEAADRWKALADEKCRTALRQYRLRPEDIPDENARVEADGSLTIYVPLPNSKEISMRIEPSEWAWLKKGSLN